MNRKISIHAPHGSLYGWLERPENPHGLIVLAHAHHVPVDSAIAAYFMARDYAVLTLDLLTAQELQFADAAQNVPRLTQRLIDILDFARNDGDMADLPLGLFATGETAPAAIRAAAQRDRQVVALVCHGGIIDHAGRQALELLAAPLLMLFDTDDEVGPAVFQRARGHLHVPCATEQLRPLADPSPAMAAWFARYLRQA